MFCDFASTVFFTESCRKYTFIGRALYKHSILKMIFQQQGTCFQICCSAFTLVRPEFDISDVCYWVVFVVVGDLFSWWHFARKRGEQRRSGGASGCHEWCADLWELNLHEANLPVGREGGSDVVWTSFQLNFRDFLAFNIIILGPST